MSDAQSVHRPTHAERKEITHLSAVLRDRRENVTEIQQAQLEEMERSAEVLRDQLKRREREFEESLLQMREHQAGGQRCVSLFRDFCDRIFI